MPQAAPMTGESRAAHTPRPALLSEQRGWSRGELHIGASATPEGAATVGRPWETRQFRMDGGLLYSHSVI